MLLAEKKERFHQKSKAVIELIASQQDTEKATMLFYDIFDSLLEDIHEVKEQKVEKGEIKELIAEMRNGFSMMNKRFEAIDKRFEAVDKRFEDMNKRFEEIIHYMDKRFDAVDKRFDAVDKRFEDVNSRFEDMNKRFVFMQWLMMFGFTLVGATIALVKIFQP